MSGKRKRVVLTMKEKLDIVENLNKGVKGSDLAKQYGIGTSTISDIKKNRDTIMKFGSLLDSQYGNKKRKTLKSAENKELESAMFTWFIQKISEGESISGPKLCEKALELNAKLGGDPQFKASTGWLKRFKSRHGIGELAIHGELSADQSVIDSFKESFEKKNALENYKKEAVCNADKSDLNKNCLPSNSLVSRTEVADPDAQNIGTANQLENNEQEDEDGREEEHATFHETAFYAFQIGINWLERQEEKDSAQLLLLNRLRDLAAKKTLTMYSKLWKNKISKFLHNIK